jgi:outer membrane lipoprotein-sorting protein
MARSGLQLLAIIAVALAGCGTLGTRAERVSLDKDAPRAEDVLRDLAANDARIQSFRASGTFVIKSPKFDATKKFRGSIRFRRPADLYVQGNDRVLNITIFRLVCVGSEFLMEFPGSRDQSFYQVEGEQFEDVPFSVSPSDIAKEMFLPERWGELKPRDVRLVAFDLATQTATLAIGSGPSPRRVVEAVRVSAETPMWVAKNDKRLKDNGEDLALTTLDQYTNVNGALFPTSVDAWFPTEQTRMTFTMRDVRLNEKISDERFNIRERARQLNLSERRAGATAAK